eukprot:scaffold9252_cov34-Tisochrysis_lutea.AAC.2
MPGCCLGSTCLSARSCRCAGGPERDLLRVAPSHGRPRSGWVVTLHEDAEGRDPLSSEQYVSKLGAERMLLHKMRWRGKACRTGMNDAMEHAVVKMQDHDGTYRECEHQGAPAMNA